MRCGGTLLVLLVLLGAGPQTAGQQAAAGNKKFDRFIDCQQCVAAGFGWSHAKRRCGGFPNRDCGNEAAAPPGPPADRGERVSVTAPAPAPRTDSAPADVLKKMEALAEKMYSPQNVRPKLVSRPPPQQPVPRPVPQPVPQKIWKPLSQPGPPKIQLNPPSQPVPQPMPQGQGLVVLRSAAALINRLGEHRVLLVEFTAPWCSHCRCALPLSILRLSMRLGADLYADHIYRELQPEMELAAESIAALGQGGAIVQLDVEAAGKAVAAGYGVGSIPSLVLLRRGVKPEPYLGQKDHVAIVAYLQRELAKPTAIPQLPAAVLGATARNAAAKAGAAAVAAVAAAAAAGRPPPPVYASNDPRALFASPGPSKTKPARPKLLPPIPFSFKQSKPSVPTPSPGRRQPTPPPTPTSTAAGAATGAAAPAGSTDRCQLAKRSA